MISKNIVHYSYAFLSIEKRTASVKAVPPCTEHRALTMTMATAANYMAPPLFTQKCFNYMVIISYDPYDTSLMTREVILLSPFYRREHCKQTLMNSDRARIWTPAGLCSRCTVSW